MPDPSLSTVTPANLPSQPVVPAGSPVAATANGSRESTGIDPLTFKRLLPPEGLQLVQGHRASVSLTCPCRYLLLHSTTTESRRDKNKPLPPLHLRPLPPMFLPGPQLGGGRELGDFILVFVIVDKIATISWSTEFSGVD